VRSRLSGAQWSIVFWLIIVTGWLTARYNHHG